MTRAEHIIWDDTARRRLRAARELLGQNQSELANALEEFGAGTVTQPTVSAWENGRIKRPNAEALTAIRQYCEAVLGADVRPSDRDVKPDSDAGAHHPPVARVPEVGDFKDIARSIANEPLLGPAQELFVTALIERLRSGPPLSAEDERTKRWLASVLNITDTSR